VRFKVARVKMGQSFRSYEAICRASVGDEVEARFTDEAGHEDEVDSGSRDGSRKPPDRHTDAAPSAPVMKARLVAKDLIQAQRISTRREQLVAVNLPPARVEPVRKEIAGRARAN
jgi:hypothetical protein